jgi:hypothetical protein
MVNEVFRELSSLCQRQWKIVDVRHAACLVELVIVQMKAKSW